MYCECQCSQQNWRQIQMAKCQTIFEKGHVVTKKDRASVKRGMVQLVCFRFNAKVGRDF
jgi:hypothetical protein